MPDVVSLYKEDHHFSDILGMVANSFEIPGDEDQSQRPRDSGGVFEM